MRLLVAVAAVLLSACSSASQRPAPGATACSGDRTVIVNNRSNRDADIIAERRDGGAPLELGSVMAGRQGEFTLPPDAGSYASVRPARDRSVPLRGGVDMRYGCRQ